MPIRKLFGNTYQEIAVVAAQPIPVQGDFTVQAEPPVGAATEAKQDEQLARMPPLVNGKIPVDAAFNGGATEAKQDTQITAIGAPSDSAAGTDTGTFSLLALFKRLLQGVTATIGHVDGIESVLGAIDADTGSIDAKLPALSNGAVPVAPNVQRDSGAVTSSTTRVTLATDGPGVSALSSIDTKTPALVSGAVPVTGTVPLRTPTTTSVASSATSVTLLASNASRRGVSISNISTSSLYMSFSTPATVANCFIELPAGAFLLLDQQLIVGSAIHGIWSSANGTAQVTEYV